MNQNNLVSLWKNVEKLMEKSVFMPDYLRKKIQKKLSNPEISREKLVEIQSLLEKVIQTEDSTIKEVLEKDPMFFKNLKRKISREKLNEKLKDEESLDKDSLDEVEEELNKFLKT